MSTQVIRSLAHGVRDIIRAIRGADHNDTTMFLLSSATYLRSMQAMYLLKKS